MSFHPEKIEDDHHAWSKVTSPSYKRRRYDSEARGSPGFVNANRYQALQENNEEAIETDENHKSSQMKELVNVGCH